MEVGLFKQRGTNAMAAHTTVIQTQLALSPLGIRFRAVSHLM